MKKSTLKLLFFIVICAFSFIGMKQVSDDRHEYLHVESFEYYGCTDVEMELNIFDNSHTTGICSHLSQDNMDKLKLENHILDSVAYSIQDLIDNFWIIFVIFMSICICWYGDD